MNGRTWSMTLVALVSLIVGVFGLMGSVVMIADGLGIAFKDGGLSAAPGVVMPYGNEAGRAVAVFGAIRGILSLLLVIGGVGTLFVSPSGRDLSLAYAVGWIIIGGVEPIWLHYRFGWNVLASSGYAFGLLLIFNTPAWKAAFTTYHAEARPGR